MMSKIHKIRLARKMTQQELADAAGVSRTGLSLIENGVVIPKIETVKKIAAALNVEWKLLFEE